MFLQFCPPTWWDLFLLILKASVFIVQRLFLLVRSYIARLHLSRRGDFLSVIHWGEKWNGAEDSEGWSFFSILIRTDTAFQIVSPGTLYQSLAWSFSIPPESLIVLIYSSEPEEVLIIWTWSYFQFLLLDLCDNNMVPLLNSKVLLLWQKLLIEYSWISVSYKDTQLISLVST